MERGREREQCRGGCMRKTLLQNHSLRKGEGLATTRFYKQWRSKYEILEVHTNTGVMPSGLSGPPVRKEERGQVVDRVV